ncbi:MAG TPA: hypothetical protein PLR52_05805 [Bacteroidales bacterium]|nr:hypothetical protein [Bacteroidota bacterium]HOP58917.1 hypothetical protein [Bacteroidales bacterium]HPR73208.1 hypothetical protein [Bacteroidales bacterium]
MRIFKIIVIILSIVVITGMLFVTDYRNLFTRHNLAPFLTIIAMIFNILALTFRSKKEIK